VDRADVEPNGTGELDGLPINPILPEEPTEGEETELPLPQGGPLIVNSFGESLVEITVDQSLDLAVVVKGQDEPITFG
jgi:hypothetical protein